MSMTADRNEEDRPFLERWSRRKREGEATDPASRPRTQTDAAETAAGEAEEASEERRLQLQRNREAAEAIDLDSLDAASDIAPFFKDGVPKALKMAAMRAMWRTSPVFANLDGLNDYDQNFADPDLIKKFTGTAWKIGRGYLTDEPEPKTDVAAADEAVEEMPEPPESVSDEKDAEDRENSGRDTAAAPDDGMPDVAAHEEAAQDSPDPDDESGEERHRVPLRTRLALDDWQAE
jgi:hypothetical protein